jgi:hypothetical protein
MVDYPDEMYRINNGSQDPKVAGDQSATIMNQTNNGLNRTGRSVADMRSTGNKFSA